MGKHFVCSRAGGIARADPPVTHCHCRDGPSGSIHCDYVRVTYDEIGIGTPAAKTRATIHSAAQQVDAVFKQVIPKQCQSMDDAELIESMQAYTLHAPKE
jgi:hypothetical protein